MDTKTLVALLDSYAMATTTFSGPPAEDEPTEHDAVMKVLGYLVKELHDIKEELHDIKETVNEHSDNRENGLGENDSSGLSD